MNVVFLPDYGDNPYQLELKRELERLKVRVFPGVRASLFPVLRSLARYRADVVHLHWTNSFLLGRNVPVSLLKSLAFVLELACCRVAGVRIVWTVHNLLNHEKYQYRLETFFGRVTARLADALITHGAFQKRETAEFYGLKDDARVFVVEQGNYAAAYENRVSRDEARARLGLRPEEKVFLFFGNLRRYKGVLELVEAFKKTEGAAARLLIAGKPHDKEIMRELEEASRDDGRIRLVPGFVPDEEVQVYMNAADAVVLPYLEITTSAALLLAFSFGKPVLAPALGPIAELSAPGGNLLYAPGDPAGLRASLREALRSDLAALGRRNLLLAARYTWEEAARKTYAVYAALLK